MTASKVETPALSAEALFGKSKSYIARALGAKGREELGEYQLWASLALELLGKAALASIHPCLVAAPQSSVSMFAAAGMNIGPDVRTIIAKTLFERLGHVSPRFDKKTQEFCVDMGEKRNAELHSGEMPFEGANPASWEGRYWHTAQIILEIRDQTIEGWLGADQAKAPKTLLAEYAHAVSEATKVKLETATEEFAALPKKERDEAHARAAKMTTWEARKNFSLVPDGVWPTKCPACASNSFLAGVKFSEEVSDQQDEEYPNEETVDVFYGAEEFHCPSCGLHLDSREEIEAAELDIEHIETDTRQREYEPDYGND